MYVDIAELVHYVSFHNVDKPLWATLRPTRGILQAVTFRIGCDLEMVVRCMQKTSVFCTSQIARKLQISYTIEVVIFMFYVPNIF